MLDLRGCRVLCCKTVSVDSADPGLPAAVDVLLCRQAATQKREARPETHGLVSRNALALTCSGRAVIYVKLSLRGDAWDASIRRQIKTCALFIPVISRTTHDRVEGYFRLEWKLAVDRSHLIATDQAFLLPVVIDGTREGDERVPERFREVQWTHLPGGEAPPAFVERIKRLLSGEPPESIEIRSMVR